ncbi:hypothetical protein FS749_009086 [Ceratobasidium sp. UAMH 11750]|nr:hypothetical protein FS749_009086 [Ceratobasidium sp. UAMH 11750]
MLASLMRVNAQDALFIVGGGDKFIQELTEPYPHPDDEAPSPESELFVPHPLDQYDAFASPEGDPPFDWFDKCPTSVKLCAGSVPLLEDLGLAPSGPAATQANPAATQASPSISVHSASGVHPGKPRHKKGLLQKILTLFR